MPPVLAPAVQAAVCVVWRRARDREPVAPPVGEIFDAVPLVRGDGGVHRPDRSAP